MTRGPCPGCGQRRVLQPVASGMLCRPCRGGQRADEHCSACGEPGHRAADGRCSAVSRAALLVIDGGLSRTEAAAQAGVSKQAVSRHLIRIGYRVFWRSDASGGER